ncbi:hypothetical protein RHMOL_Rhmol08G0240600 [Rhododendron molle]|uniref:Uncharacterized protein n=2 Tax=Rhododendron molle TaxID=49168 RepID=A0ACC0MRM9_RHOML|nr:hypothetical protein RHMOL_Rhmol08G0240600 [Rhododendron molle]KAI8543723.1 hypothetical protein RHMOL_Rhmol08G0240600 [Rhododendron molle]
MTLGIRFKNDFKYDGWRAKSSALCCLLFSIIRWASARRGGMTVLGKVAVPKPLNLPSQRLENHGMDPTVEIVPKGTLSWGSRPSSSTSNPWGSSTLSPKADGGTSSPSHLSGRPSSGSGTRPSSSCSDRTHELNSNAWGPSSRPSSASGALASNQTALTSLRPRSAETRPGSSHLSRFAETSSDSSVAWGPTGVSEKLGVASSRNDGFSLSSGDFPTLGSEKENSGKSADSQDHGPHSRPGSSSRVASGKENSATSSVGDNAINANVTVNTWRRDGPQHVEEGMFQPPVEKWQGDPPPYLNANVPPQHFDAWRGPPLNPPPGVWYRGPPGGPPYATPVGVGPGGFPMEPFPYYRPQIPPPALANSQPVPPGPGPRGHHPKNGDMYRPHIPDGYVRPGMPLRPGFYPGPMPYEGYYGPPMAYCNSSERDFPYMGMPAGPPIYNRYPGENAPPDPGNNHARAGPHGPTGRAPGSEQLESGPPEEARGPYKVLLKQHNEWDETRAEDKWEHTVPDNAPYGVKGDPPRKSLKKNEWGSEDRKDDEIYSGRRILGGDDISSQNFDNRGRYSSDLPESRGKAKTGQNSVHKSENEASTFSQGRQAFPATPKDSTLLQKIDGLNAKVRASDGRPDAASVPRVEEQMSRSQVVTAKVNHPRHEGGTDFGRIHTSGNLVPGSRELDIPTAGNALHSTSSSGTTDSRRASHGVQGRLDHRGKRFNTPDADGWRKKPLGTEFTGAVSALNSESSSNVHVQDHLSSVIAAETYVINLQEKDEGESLAPMFDPSDCQEQRAKMREIAKQRALQLQKEEEERIREQKAKALAKLEELNRRTQATDGNGSTQKLEKAPPSVSIQQEKEECQVPTEQVMVASKPETPTSEFVSNPNAQTTKSSAIEAVESTHLSNAPPMETSENSQLKPVVPHTVSAADPKAATQVNEGGTSRHKRMGHKQRQNISLGGNLTEKSVPISSTEAQKNSTDVAVNDALTEVVAGEVGPSHESSLPVNSNVLMESSAHQRRKFNRSSKNKHKSDDVPSVTALVPKETNAEKASFESGKLGSSELELDLSSVHFSEQQRTSLPNEEPSGRANSQWKSQHTRRMPKSQQANRNAEKDAVMWAPVRSDKKAEFIDEASNRTIPDPIIGTAKADSVIHNNTKSKRAEMERYVPKPVAKEQLAQQTLLDETVENCQTVNLTIGNIVCTVESGNGNDNQNKQSKAPGSWRQRGSPDGSSSILDPSQNIQESIEQQQQSLKPEVNSMKEKTKLSDDLNASDGWNTSETFDTAAPVSSALVKEQGVITGRGKRQAFRGQRNIISGDNDKSSSQTPAPEIVGQTDKSSAAKENRTTSQWQPKSQVYAFPNQRASRPGGGQSGTAAEARNPIKKDSHSHDRVQMASDHKNQRAEHTVQPSNEQSVPEQKNEVVIPNEAHQESKREKNVASFRGQPNPPNQNSAVSTTDLVPLPSGDTENEQQRFSSGFRKNGNQNNRSGRVHESRGDWSLGGQDNRQHNNTSSNRERQRHNSHYEYQPIGQQNYSKTNNSEGSVDGSHNPGTRYRERSQGNSRRGGGNFGNRQGGTARVDASYD